MSHTIELPGGVPLAWVEIPAGRLLMGSERGRDDERPVHAVALPAFGLGRTPVTREQYAAFLEDTGAPPPPGWDDARFQRPLQPAVGMSWHEASDFTSWLSGLTARVVRLPSEAEWERGMRGGLEQQPTAWGLALPAGEIPDGALEAPWDVGAGTANAFGLCDPGTVVHEWCLDWYAAGYYAGSPASAPRGPEEGTRRASRGGSWRHKVRWSPPSARSSLPPEFHYADYGFRVLVELKEGTVGRSGSQRLEGRRNEARSAVEQRSGVLGECADARSRAARPDPAAE